MLVDVAIALGRDEGDERVRVIPDDAGVLSDPAHFAQLLDYFGDGCLRFHACLVRVVVPPMPDTDGQRFYDALLELRNIEVGALP